MEMPHRLAGIGAAVADHTVAVRDTDRLGDRGDRFEDVGNQLTVLGCYLVDRCDVRARNDQDVYGCLRIDIAEAIDLLILIYTGRGDLACGDLAEKAVFHRYLLLLNIVRYHYTKTF